MGVHHKSRGFWGNGEHRDPERVVPASWLGENRKHLGLTAQGSSFLLLQIRAIMEFSRIYDALCLMYTTWVFHAQSALSVGNLEFPLSVVQQMIRSAFLFLCVFLYMFMILVFSSIRWIWGFVQDVWFW